MTVEFVVSKEFQKELIEIMAYAAIGDGLPPQESVDKLLKYKKKKIILVTGAPRSGATWLANTLGKVTNTPPFRLCSAYGTNEHDLYLPSLCLGNVGCFSLIHMKGTYHNNELLKLFGIKPIILVRNIYDIIINLANNMKEKQKDINSRNGFLGFSFFWSDVNIEKLNDINFLNWIIDFAVPWYVNFYVSWYRLNPDAIWIKCEEFVKDPYITVKNILTFLEILPETPLTKDILDIGYPTADGEPIFKELTLAQRIRIAMYFEYYSDVDFKKYGMM